MVLYETRIVNPLALRFSQSRIRPQFQDGRNIEESIDCIETIDIPAGLSEEYECALRHPFPNIEIIRWKPTTREEDGKPILKNGEEVFGEEEWFTFDNRRLYCLQKAALKMWPRPVCVIVHSLRDMPAIRCAVRKFKTTSAGRQVDICHQWNNVHRYAEKKITWDWMRQVNLNEHFMARTAIPYGYRSVLMDQKKTWEELEDSATLDCLELDPSNWNSSKDKLDVNSLFAAAKNYENGLKTNPNDWSYHQGSETFNGKKAGKQLLGLLNGGLTNGGVDNRASSTTSNSTSSGTSYNAYGYGDYQAPQYGYGYANSVWHR